MQIYKNKRVFITGHSGFKGSWLSLYLKELGAEVFGYSLPPKELSHFRLLAKDLEIDSTFEDILDYQKLSKALSDFNPHIVFHLAAQPLVRESYKDPLSTFSINTIGTLNVLNAARSIKSLEAIVVITTDKVYKNNEWHWGYRENDRLGGYDPYSASKACAEIVVDSMRSSFFNNSKILLATARAGNVIGGGDFSIDRLIPDLVRGILDNKTSIIRSPGATRPWQIVLEPLRGYLMLGAKLLEGKSEFATSFNFGPNNDGNLSVKEVLESAKKLWDRIDYEIIQDDCNMHEANLLMLDTSKARAMLGYEPIYNIKDSITKSIEWYRAFVEEGSILSKAQLKAYMAKASKVSMAKDSIIASMGGGL